MRPTLQLLAVMAAAFVAGGCLDEDIPAYVNNGQTVVAAYDGAIWTYDIQKKVVTSHPFPKEWEKDPAKILGDLGSKKIAADGRWELDSARTIGDQVWVIWKIRVQDDDEGNEHDESVLARFDPARNAYVLGPPELRYRKWSQKPIAGSYKGKPCVFVEGEEKGDLDVLSFPELKKQATIFIGWPKAAGGFWWVNDSRKEGLDVFDPNANLVCTIPHDELVKANPGHETEPRFQGPRGRLEYARISDDGKALFVVFRKNQFDSFGVFDTTNGSFLWGDPYRFRGRGNPVVKQTEVWTIESVEDPRSATATASMPASKPTTSSRSFRPSVAALVRYTPGKGKDAQTAQRDTIAILPIHANDRNGLFNPSPDRSHFVMVGGGGLLFIPIKEGVTAADIRVVELIDRK